MSDDRVVRRVSINFRTVPTFGLVAAQVVFDYRSADRPDKWTHGKEKGVAICHSTDVFNEAKGQRVALQHALQDCDEIIQSEVFRVWLKSARKRGPEFLKPPREEEMPF